MKVQITCPKCGSSEIKMVENPESKTPIYKCDKCGYEKTLFPQFGKEKDKEE